LDDFRKIYPTYQAALFGSILVFFPAGYALGLDGLAWARSLSFHSTKKTLQEQLLFLNFYGGFIGAWLGGIALPLDWQRDWQVSFLDNIFLEIRESLFQNLFSEMAYSDCSRSSVRNFNSFLVLSFDVFFESKEVNIIIF
jgi:hypothetical protein